jgi:thiosulfate dehydrogenase (quinone) large subunit
MTKKQARIRHPQPDRSLERPPQPQLPASDRWAAYGILPLRLFLGATFVYAGLQKIWDPGLLQPGSGRGHYHPNTGDNGAAQLEEEAATDEVGPAPTALASIAVQVGSDGGVYAD